MDVGRRTLIVVIGVLVIAAPAGILRAACIGNACDATDSVAARVPFCSLPATVRNGLVQGFYPGRSPDVLAVTSARTDVVAREGRPVVWPSVESGPARVPLMITGPPTASPIEIPSGTRLDSLAPTIAAALDVHRPHPEVRSGTALGNGSAQAPARVAVIIVWKGIAAPDLEAAEDDWARTRAIFADGTVSLDATTGSLPVSDAAVMATIGTGGMPRQHGITGPWIRTDEGDVVRAVSDAAPVSVIATLGDDLDEQLGQRPLVGLVGTAPTDRAAIGGRWYAINDRDAIRISRPESISAVARAVLRSGFGDDDAPDLLVVAVEGDVATLDKATSSIAKTARAVTDDSAVIAVTATGRDDPSSTSPLSPAEVLAQVESSTDTDGLIEAIVPGGLFVDQGALAERSISEDVVVDALSAMTSEGRRVFDDVFSDVAVTFARYC